MENSEIRIQKFVQGSGDTQKQLPKSIWEIINSPNELFIQGKLSAFDLLNHLPEKGLAVVGTRNPQPRSLALVKKSIEQLKNSNLIIISGLARGIDTCAHLAALESGLPTIAVLGAGLDIDYPKENADLKKRILNSNGLLISEFPLGMPALSHQFLKRNRLIAGWSKATWVVEAASRSGALNTARWAREQNRTCYAVPCFPNDPALAGNQILLDRDYALPFWGAQSLESTWLDLVSVHFSEQLERSTQLSKLIQKVQQLTCQHGSCQVQDLVSWANEQGWSTQVLFSILQLGIEQRAIQEYFGTFLASSKEK